MDEPASGRSGSHADRAVRLAGRRAAVPRQPDPRAPAAGVPQAAGHAAQAGAAGARHRRAWRSRSPTRAPPRTLAPQGQLEGAGAVRDAGRNHRAAGQSAEAYIKRALSDAGERAPRRGASHGLARMHQHQCGAPRAYQTTPVFAGGTAEPDGPRRVRDERRSCAVDRAARAARPRGRKSSPPSTTPALGRPRRRDVRRRGAAVGRRGAGAGDADAVRSRSDARRAGAGAVGDHHARPQRRSRPTTSRSSRRAGSDTTGGLARPGTLRLHLPDEVADLGAVQRRRRQSARRRRRRAAAPRRRGAGGAPDRLAASAAETRRAGRPTAAVLARASMRWRSTSASRWPAGCSASPPAPPIRRSACRAGSVDPADACRSRSRSPAAATSPGSASTISARSVQIPNVAREAPAYELDAERRHAALRRRRARPRARARNAHAAGVRAASAAAAPAICAAGSLTELSATPHRRPQRARRSRCCSRSPPTAGRGRRDAGGSAEQRIPALLRHRDRAVTDEDYRRLAVRGARPSTSAASRCCRASSRATAASMCPAWSA